VSKILSPLIIHLIELEISRQFLGKLENVKWSEPLTEPNRYAAVMLLGDVRRRLHYAMNYVDLPKLGKLDFWGLRQMRLVPGENSGRPSVAHVPREPTTAQGRPTNLLT